MANMKTSFPEIKFFHNTQAHSHVKYLGRPPSQGTQRHSKMLKGRPGKGGGSENVSEDSLR